MKKTTYLLYLQHIYFFMSGYKWYYIKSNRGHKTTKEKEKINKKYDFNLSPPFSSFPTTNLSFYYVSA